MLKAIHFSIITLITFFIFSSFDKQKSEDDLIKIDYIINQSKEINDSVKLQEKFSFLKQNYPKSFKENLDVIYTVFLAKIYSASTDKINTKSEQLFKQALVKAKKLNNPELLIWLNTENGAYYYQYNEFLKAFPYFMQASKLLETTSDKQLFQKTAIYKKNAFFFNMINDKEKAEQYYLSALKTANKTEKNYGTILNSLGNNYFEKKEYNKAFYYFEQTKTYAIQNNDQIRYAKALGDLALVYIQQKNYPKAIELLKKDIEISTQLKEDRNNMFAQIRLGKLYLQLQQIDDAKIVLNKAKNYSVTKQYLNTFSKEIYVLLLDIALKQNDVQTEFDARRKIDELETLINEKEGENIFNIINWEIQKDNFNYQLETEKIKREKSNILRNSLYTIVSLLCIIIVFIYVAFKRKIKIQNTIYENTLLNLKLDKLNSENKLNEAYQTLDTYKIYLSEKNIQIKALHKEINKIERSNEPQLESKKKQLNDLLISHLMTETNWNNFKNIFIYEQKEFYQKITDNLPNVTDSNLRIIFLNRLGLNNVEISRLVGTSPESVKKAKQRLKKKYRKTELFIEFN